MFNDAKWPFCGTLNPTRNPNDDSVDRSKVTTELTVFYPLLTIAPPFYRLKGTTV
jgi:hypothetical protein